MTEDVEINVLAHIEYNEISRKCNVSKDTIFQKNPEKLCINLQNVIRESQRELGFVKKESSARWTFSLKFF